MQFKKTMNVDIPVEIIEKYPDVFENNPKSELVNIHGKPFLQIEGISEPIAVTEEFENEFDKDIKNMNRMNNIQN